MHVIYQSLISADVEGTIGRLALSTAEISCEGVTDQIHWVTQVWFATLQVYKKIARRIFSH